MKDNKKFAQPNLRISLSDRNNLSMNTENHLNLENIITKKDLYNHT